ncbi:hypothetical protein INR49_019090 [Caranx melampygus]|nr:hypothetical protein INR49_019090 [Caranx melampygus]
MQVLVSIYKVNEKKGRKGEKRKEKRQKELGILQLFEKEGQEWIKAKKEGREKVVGGIEKNVKKTEKLMAEVDAPFSHVAPVQRPPPYEKEVELGELYPQLPVISQEGNYLLRDEDEQVIEMGKAETTIKMYPSTKKNDVQFSLEELEKMFLPWDDDELIMQFPHINPQPTPSPETPVPAETSTEDTPQPQAPPPPLPVPELSETAGPSRNREERGASSPARHTRGRKNGKAPRKRPRSSSSSSSTSSSSGSSTSSSSSKSRSRSSRSSSSSAPTRADACSSRCKKHRKPRQRRERRDRRRGRYTGVTRDAGCRSCQCFHFYFCRTSDNSSRRCEICANFHFYVCSTANEGKRW